MFARFVRSEVAGSALLLGATVVALLWANSRWRATYAALSHLPVGLSVGRYSFTPSLAHWVNDLLMSVFFFVVGLEIKRELAVGQLASMRRAILPVSAALGGMVVPAALFACINPSGPGHRGWGVPMATDIAFTLGVLSLFGRRVPIGLKVFLAALAIADDLGAVLVIALFYAEGLRPLALLAALLPLALLRLAAKRGVRHPAVYLLLAGAVWAAVMVSGVHATVAGILVAMLVPLRSHRDPREALAVVSERFHDLESRTLTPQSAIDDRLQLDAILDLHVAAADLRPPALTLEHELHPLVAFLILPLFALFNAGVVLEGGVVETLRAPVSLGIVAGLVLGKQAGIFLFSWLAVRTGRASLPDGVTWSQVYGGACLAGIGFTMSLFVADLAFGEGSLLVHAKFAILAASLIAALWGWLWLHRALPRPRVPHASDGGAR